MGIMKSISITHRNKHTSSGRSFQKFFRRHPPSNSAAFTLVEVLISVFLLAVGAMASLLFISKAISATVLSSDLTIATTHAEYVLEEMNQKTTLAAIQAVNWTSWAQTQGLMNIPSEVVTVSYNNVGGAVLWVTVDVAWNRDGRTNHMVAEARIYK